MAKGGMWQDLDVQTTDGLTYTFTFKQDVAGGKTMLSKLPLRTSGSQQVFDLQMGKPTNEQLGQLTTNEEWYRQAPFDAWDPTKVSADQDRQAHPLSIARDKTSSDAFFDLAKLTSRRHARHRYVLRLGLSRQLPPQAQQGHGSRGSSNQGFKAPVSELGPT